MDARSRTRPDVNTVIDQDPGPPISTFCKALRDEENIASRKVAFANLYHINSRVDGTLSELN